MANQQMRFSEEELDLIKRTFNNNEALLKSVRKVMLQLPLDVIDQTSLLVFKKEDLMMLMRRVFLPELKGDVPIGQQIDLWMTINIDGKCVEDAYDLLVSRKKLIDYIEQQLECLNDTNKVGKIRFEDLVSLEGKEEEDLVTDVIARNTMVGHTENQILQLQILSSMKDETEEEKKDRELKDSNN